MRKAQKTYGPPHWYQLYTKKYAKVLTGEYDPDKTKIQVFEKTVLPSLCEPKITKTNSGGFRITFQCRFAECQVKTNEFATKQKLMHHTINIHGSVLPGSGAFLVQNDAMVQPGGFRCISCAHIYSRKDKFLDHMDRSEKCHDYSTASFLSGRVPTLKTVDEFSRQRAFYKTEAANIINDQNNMKLLETSFSMFGICSNIEKLTPKSGVPWRSHSMPKRKKSLERDVIIACRYRLDVLRSQEANRKFAFLYMRSVEINSKMAEEMKKKRTRSTSTASKYPKSSKFLHES
jgi:hypothetical protein